MSDPIAMISVALALVLVVAAHLVGRRPGPRPDPERWHQERTEPWGTIATVAVLASPVALALWWATGSVLGALALLAAVVVWAARRTHAIGGVREIAVTADAVWVRSLRRVERVPMAYVVGVRYRADGLEVVLASGRAIALPAGPAGERLGATIARRAGRWRRSFVDV